MTFTQPEWLILLAVIPFIAWTWKRLGVLRPLRLMILLLAVLILCELANSRTSSGTHLYLLVDRSKSTEGLIEKEIGEVTQLLKKSKGSEDKLTLVPFADSAQINEQGSEVFQARAEQTRTRLALSYILGQTNPKENSRILLLSDGYSSEPLGNIGEKLLRQSVPLDYRLLGASRHRDIRITKFEIKSRVQPGEPFLIDMEIQGDQDIEVPFTLSREGKVLARDTFKIQDGHGFLRFSDRLTSGGAFPYTLNIHPKNDPIPGNNHRKAWVEVQGGSRFLVITSYTNDPLVSAMRRVGLEVDVAQDFTHLSMGRLSGARAVIINNVPAYKLPSEFMEALNFYVRVQGGGLMMVGGKFSFGSGGYFQSAIDPLLPLSMELKQEHRKLAVAIAMVMDRSGSMGAPVGGGLTKMDLANEGVARSIELLGSMDMVSVYAVDSEAHQIFPLMPVGANKEEMLYRTRRIISTGGGIYVYTGLEAAWRELQQAEVGQRHIILFTDAADSEEPGDYINLIEEMVKGGASISVIGLGSESDSDADFIKDIAARGNGRIFFNSDPNTLPAIFAQETVAVARSAFIEEPIACSHTASWMELSSQSYASLKKVGGYNLSYLKEKATALIYSEDEYHAPLLGIWSRGAGRSAAVAFPLSGEFSSELREWKSYGNFIQTLCRWLMGEDTPKGVGFKTKLEGHQLSVDLFYDDELEGKLLSQQPTLKLVEGFNENFIDVTWTRQSPGHFHADVPLKPGSFYRGAISILGQSLPFGPIQSGHGVEWDFDSSKIRDLQRVCELSGGRARLNLSEVWSQVPELKMSSLTIPLLFLLLLLVILEMMVSRWGLHLPKVKWAHLKIQKSKVGKTKKSQVKKEKPPVQKTTPTPLSEDKKEEEQVSRRDRFNRAKKGG